MNEEKINQTEGRRLETRRELAKRYSVSTRTVANWMRDKLVPWLQISARTIRFDPREVDAALARNHRIAARGEVV
jgi:DNA-binding XRE family transcriptional regulator